jgi:RNA polymerase sigma-70 factor
MPQPLLKQVLEEGARAWPDVKLEPGQVRAFLESRTPPLKADPSSRAPDLYLACACLCGIPEALRQLEALCRLQLRLAARRLGVAIDEDDARAALLSKLLVAPSDSAPRLNQYAGRAQLSRWIRVVAVRQVLDAKETQSRDVPIQELLLASALSEAPREWKGMDGTSRLAFKEALGRALKDLSVRDRNLLRLRLEGLNTVAIAAFFRVHRPTVSLWLKRVNATVQLSVRRELRQALRIPSQEVDSLLRSVLSGIDTSIRCRLTSAFGGG